MCISIRACGLALAMTAGTLMLPVPVLANTFEGASPVSDRELDDIRGGFSIEYGLGQLRLALEFTRSSWIGAIQESAQHWAAGSGGAPNVIQHGPNNVVTLPVLNNLNQAALSTVIQNSVSDQIISNVNTLNITITNQAVSRAMALQSLTQDAFLRFLY